MADPNEHMRKEWHREKRIVHRKLYEFENIGCSQHVPGQKLRPMASPSYADLA